MGIAAEMMTKDLKRSGGVAKGACHLVGGAAIDEISAESLIHALLGVVRHEEEAAAIA